MERHHKHVKVEERNAAEVRDPLLCHNYAPTFPGTDKNLSEYYDTFTTSLPDGFGYSVTLWVQAPPAPGGFWRAQAGCFLIDTPIGSTNEPGIGRYLTTHDYSRNFTYSNDACQLNPSSVYNFV